MIDDVRAFYSCSEFCLCFGIFCLVLVGDPEVGGLEPLKGLSHSGAVRPPKLHGSELGVVNCGVQCAKSIFVI